MLKGKLHITTSNSALNGQLYRFGADGNMRLYSYDRLFYSLYGYDGGTTRTYKYSFDLNPNWVNGRLESVNFSMHNAMFYPNSYLNFNSNGYYTKHYYNGTERIASRLGDQNLPINVNDPELQDRKDWQDSLIRRNVTEITGYEFLPVGEEQNPEDPKPVFELPQVGLTNLIPNTSSIYYYHPNHLGSTCYVTDGNASVVQGFLYAPFGEITNEYNNSFGSSVLPKYSFNAKELDEETGMYYYEARYYAPPVFISRDPLFEEKPWFTPYHYCSNNPVVRVDPTGEDDWEVSKDGHIRKLEDQTLSISGKDRLRREGMTNWDNCVVVRQGVITEQELDYKNGVEGSFLLINGSREEAVGIFKYCADNTDVEYSLIELEGINKNEQMQTDIYLTTSHVVYGPTEAGSDDYGSELSKIYAGMLKSHLHSHKRYNVSWHNREDVKFKEAIENRKKDIKDSKPAKFGVYKCKGNERNTTDYAGNRIDPITMERLK